MQVNAQHEVDLSGTLPSDIVLTADETLELLKLETLYDKAVKETALTQTNFNIKIVTSQFKIFETTNVGIHYFCIKNDIELFALSGNNNISLNVVSLVFDRIKDKDFKSFQVAYYSLLSNPLVYEDFNVFKLIFEKVYSTDGEAERLLYSFRNLAFLMPVNVLMFLLTTVGEVRTTNLTEFYSNVIEIRKNEITEWLQENFPELVELPLNWVLHSRVLKNVSV
jgi:hypothetical protein